MTRQRQISEDVLAALSSMRIEGNVLKRCEMQLDRKVYEGLNKALEALGGKWNRRAQGHVFAEDPTERVTALIATGSYACPRLAGWFPTPMWVADMVAERIAERLDILDMEGVILEPSAGEGALAQALVRQGYPSRDIVCVELDAGRAATLRAQGYRDVAEADFLTWLPAGYTPIEAVVMNPPFGRGEEVRHLARAMDLLRPGGRLVAIMPASLTFRQDRAFVGVRTVIESWRGTIEPLPDGTFAEAGTQVRTVLVVADKPQAGA